jgi:carbonic anhydrase
MFRCPLIIPEIQNNAKLQMSVYSSAANWGGACKGVNQTPINLSQSFAKPCDILCDLVFDEGYVSSAKVYITDEGLVLMSQTGLGTCKYNGTGYTCNAVLVNHPSHHTIENIQADAEVIALFSNPTGKYLLVCSLVRVNPTHTDSSKFLNAFIPYATTQFTEVKFGDDWSLSMMVPPKASYYSYSGSIPLGMCGPAQVVVFSSMINMDSNNFALLVKNVPAGSRPIQSLGNREVFFNSGEQLPGGHMPRDGKIYMRLRPKKDDGKRKKQNITQPDITGPQKDEQSKAGFVGYLSQWARDQVQVNGVFSLVNALLLFIAFGLAVYCAYKYNEKVQFLLILNNKAVDFAYWITGKSGGGASSISKPVGQLLPSISNIAEQSVTSMQSAAEKVSSAVVPAVLEPVDDITAKGEAKDMSKSARKLDIPAAAAPEPVKSAVDAVGDEVTSNPVGDAVSSATRAAENAPANIAPGVTGASSRILQFKPTQARGGPVNVDNLLSTTGKTESGKSGTDKAKGSIREPDGSRTSQGPTRIRRQSVAG